MFPVLDSETADKIRSALSKGDDIPTDVLEILRGRLGGTTFKNLKAIKTWKELVNESVKLLDGMKSEVYIASRYFASDISKAGVRASARGGRIHVLHSARRDVSVSRQISEIIDKDPEAERIFRRIIENPNIDSKEAGLFFSFIVIDSLIVAVEIINIRAPDDFFFAIEFEDEKISLYLIEYYNQLEKSGFEDRRRKGNA